MSCNSNSTLSNRIIEITMMMSHWHHQGSFLRLQYFSSPFRAGFSSLTTRSKLFFMCKTLFSHNKATEVDKSKIRSVSQPVRIFLKQISIALSYYQIIFVFVPMFIHLHRFYLAVVRFSLHELHLPLSAWSQPPYTCCKLRPELYLLVRLPAGEHQRGVGECGLNGGGALAQAGPEACR